MYDINTNGGSGAYENYWAWRPVFDVTVASRLSYVHVYPQSAGNVVVRLLDSNATVLDTHTQVVSNADIGQKTAIGPLAFVLPVGTGYQLDPTGSAVTGLWRSVGGNSYPMPGTAVNITGTTANPANYYWFHEWITDHSARMRTAAYAHGGTGAATLDKWDYTGTEYATGYLTFTLNMSNYNANTDGVHLEFMLRDHGEESDADDRVWVAGSSSSSWVELGNLNTLSGGNSFVAVTGLDVSAALVGAGQNFSSTFQIRFGQYDNYDAPMGDGFSFDDLSLSLGQVCGNGTTEGSEVCDDGNTADCDGCRGDCSAVETGCGDTFVCGNETCDDGCSSTCMSEGTGGGTTSSGTGGGTTSSGTGGTTSSGVGGASSSSGSDGDTTDDGGCGCRVVGPSQSNNLAALGLLGLLGLVVRRRRRAA